MVHATPQIYVTLNLAAPSCRQANLPCKAAADCAVDGKNVRIASLLIVLCRLPVQDAEEAGGEAAEGEGGHKRF